MKNIKFFFVLTLVFALNISVSEASVADVTNDGNADVADTQCLINASLFQPSRTQTLADCIKVPFEKADLNCDQKINVIDVQISLLINLKKPLSSNLDANENGLPDCQEIEIEPSCEWQWKTDSHPEYILYDVWASNKDNIYAVGTTTKGSSLNPVILHFDGEKWEKVSTIIITSSSSGYLRSIWGFGENDIYIAGEYGTGTDQKAKILHFDGTKWEEMSMEESPVKGTHYWEIWAFDENNIYVSGSQPIKKGFVLKYDKDTKQWKVAAKDIASSYLDIWGTSEKDIFVTSPNDGLIYKFDGLNITKAFESAEFKLEGFWGLKESNEFYAQSNAENTLDDQLLKFNEATQKWEKTASYDGLSINNINGTSKNNIYAFGHIKTPAGTIANSWAFTPAYLEYNGTEWKINILKKTDDQKVHTMSKSWITNEGEIIAIDSYGGETYRYICE